MQPLEDPPSLIADAPGLQIWHKLDRTFKRPIAVAYLCITPRSAYDSARTAALTHLVLKLLQDNVCETAYLADVAGLQYDVRAAFPQSHACCAQTLQSLCGVQSCAPLACAGSHVESVGGWPHALSIVCLRRRQVFGIFRKTFMCAMVCEASRGSCGLQAWPEGMAGIELKVNGFSHKLPLLLEQLVQALAGLKVRMASSFC